MNVVDDAFVYALGLEWHVPISVQVTCSNFEGGCLLVLPFNLCYQNFTFILFIVIEKKTKLGSYFTFILRSKPCMVGSCACACPFILFCSQEFVSRFLEIMEIPIGKLIFCHQYLCKWVLLCLVIECSKASVFGRGTSGKAFILGWGWWPLFFCSNLKGIFHFIIVGRFAIVSKAYWLLVWT